MAVLSPRRWQRIEDLFFAALDLEPAARSAFLEEACGDDSALREELESLLESSKETLDFAREAVVQVVQQEAAEGESVGRRIGAYELLSVLGKGGMGTVYLAARADDLYQQDVAIKLMHTHVAPAPGMRLRFSAERQILANLNHPNIARLLDGGITADGQQYLVMEYVNGVPIDEYCRVNRLSTEDLIGLFLKVCAAIEYAHQNLVIHRDIKPGNILVTPEGVPKLLDFGIAKLLDDGVGASKLTLNAEKLTTEQMMTPEYASPEQVRGEPVSTATDVYTLGVLLYELVCGRRPFPPGRKRALEIMTMICEHYPDPPSKVLRADSQLVSPAHYRKYRDDLDNIVLMAMRKEPARRYESVALFASDLRRCLEGKPVQARTDTWTYTSSRFVRRHKAGVILTAIAVIALIGFSIGMGILARRATRERLAAEQQTLAARQEADFLASIFEAATPDATKGKQITARDLLDASQKRIDRELANVPAVRAMMLDDVGQAYTNLGLYDQAKPLLQRAYDLQRLAPGDKNLDMAATAWGLARLYRLQGNYEKAEPLFRQALAIREKAAGTNHLLVAESLTDLGECLYMESRDTEAEQVLRQALALDAQPANELGATTRNYLALELERKGKLDEAAQLLREAVDIARRTEGEVSPDYAIFLQNLGGAFMRLGDLSTAEATERRALEARRKLSGDDHPDIAYALNLLGWILIDKGEWPQAEPLFHEALTVRQRLLGEQHPLYAGSLSSWARLLQAKGDYGTARELFKRALQILENAGQSQSWSSALVVEYLGLLELDQGNYPQAERYARQALEMAIKLGGNENPQVASSLTDVALAREFQSDLAGAETLFSQALQIRRNELSPGHPSVIAAEVRLGEALTSEGKLNSAGPLLSDAVKSAHSSPFSLQPWQVAEADSAMGAYLVKRGKMSQGESLLRNTDVAMRDYPQAAMRRRILQRTTLLERALQSQTVSAK